MILHRTAVKFRSSMFKLPILRHALTVSVLNSLGLATHEGAQCITIDCNQFYLLACDTYLIVFALILCGLDPMVCIRRGIALGIVADQSGRRTLCNDWDQYDR